MFSVVAVPCTLVILITGAIGYFRTLDATLGKSTECEVHHTRMLRTRVRVSYGFPVGFHSGAPAPPAVRLARFPHPNSPLLGGCVITPSSAQHAYVLVCPDCEKARQQFIASRTQP